MEKINTITLLWETDLWIVEVNVDFRVHSLYNGGSEHYSIILIDIQSAGPADFVAICPNVILLGKKVILFREN